MLHSAGSLMMSQMECRNTYEEICSIRYVYIRERVHTAQYKLAYPSFLERRVTVIPCFEPRITLLG